MATCYACGAPRERIGKVMRQHWAGQQEVLYTDMLESDADAYLASDKAARGNTFDHFVPERWAQQHETTGSAE
jgi:hypothetical protein